MNILDITRPEDLFGALTGSVDEQLAQATSVWRELARTLHPDAGGVEDQFVRLSELWEVARAAIAAGTYGTTRSPLVNPVIVQTRRRAYRLTHMMERGDSCNVYAATYTNREDDEAEALLKITRSIKDNDLIVNESRVLKQLLSYVDTYDVLAPYLPRYLETFGYRAPGEKRPRQANAFTTLGARLVSLREVRERYPQGVHPKDAAWMLRRLLMGLGLTHQHGIVHGAVTPDHVLIQPEMHGLVLVDWKYAVETNQSIAAISAPWRWIYPPEVIAKAPATPATDIYMASWCMAYVMGCDGEDLRAIRSSPIRAFTRGCLNPRPSRRPQDAFALKNEYDELIERLWGPRRFRPFVV